MKATVTATALIVAGGLAFGAAAPVPAFAQQTLQGDGKQGASEDRIRMKARKVAKEQCKDKPNLAQRGYCEKTVEERVYERIKAKQK